MKNSRQGSILVYTLIVVALLCVIATSTLSRSFDDYRADLALADRIRAHYLAEAGSVYALASLRDQPFVPCPSGRMVLNLPAGLLPAEYAAPEVHLERMGNGKWQVVSVGRSGIARQVVRRLLD